MPTATDHVPPEVLLAALRESEEALALLQGEEARVVWSSRGLDRLLCPEGVVASGPLSELLGSGPPLVGQRRLHQAISQHRSWKGEVHLHLARGRRITEAHVSPVPGPGGLPHTLLSLQDITRRRSSEERLYHLAHYDAVTGLPNRKLFHDRLNQAIRRARRYGEVVAVLFLDLDQFKVINDTHGHAMGDRVLRAVGQRLSGAVRDSDTVARLAGDEFTVVLPGLTHPQHATLVAEKLLAATGEPLGLSGQQLRVLPSVGVAVFPEDGRSPTSLLEKADAAMYAAKRGGRARVVRWHASLEDRAHHASPPLLQHLESALEHHQLDLRFLPVFDARSQAITGAEALLRWDHPTRGTLCPAEFLSMTVGTPLELRIARWTLRAAALEALTWPQEPRLIVNLSPSLLADERLPDLVQEVLDDVGLPAWRLELDLAEGPLAASDFDLQPLRDLGLRLAVDDFGTGHLPLSRLRTGELHALKLDGSLVRTVGTSSEPMLRALVALARSLGLDVMAEEVETPEQHAFLQAQGCARMQGFYLSRPLEPEAMRRLLLSGA